MVPLAEERVTWLGETRRVAREAILDLRAAGLAGGFLVLQWRALGEVARVLDHWTCRYEADADRHRELARVVTRWLADWQYVSTHRPALADELEPTADPAIVEVPFVRPAAVEMKAPERVAAYGRGGAGSGSTV